jgi:hypothetical protein
MSGTSISRDAVTPCGMHAGCWDRKSNEIKIRESKYGAGETD